MINTTLLFMGGIGGWEIILILLGLLLPLILIVWAIVDLVKGNFQDNTNKIVWAIFIIFMPILGALVYLIFGRSQKIS